MTPCFACDSCVVAVLSRGSFKTPEQEVRVGLGTALRRHPPQRRLLYGDMPLAITTSTATGPSVCADTRKWRCIWPSARWSSPSNRTSGLKQRPPSPHPETKPHPDASPRGARAPALGRGRRPGRPEPLLRGGRPRLRRAPARRRRPCQGRCRRRPRPPAQNGGNSRRNRRLTVGNRNAKVRPRPWRVRPCGCFMETPLSWGIPDCT